MTKVCVFIPTHIYYDNQINLLTRCLDSIINQSIKPDILVSVSFHNQEFEKLFSSKILTPFSDQVKFTISNSQKYQMEHIKILSDLYSDKYDLIMFSDDDDTYNYGRVNIFIKAFKESKKTKNMTFGGVREITDMNNKNQAEEYWCYGLVPNILTEFFNRFKSNMDLLQNNYADMYLRSYLRKINRFNKQYAYMCINPETKLYNYNLDNPDSICSRASSNLDEECPSEEHLRNVLLLYIINKGFNDKTDKYYIDQLMLILKKRNIDIDNLLPNRKHIDKFCQKLYL